MKIRTSSLLLAAVLASTALVNAQLVIDFESNTPPDPSPFVQTTGFGGNVTTINVTKGNGTSNVLYVTDVTNNTVAAAGNNTLTGIYVNPTQVFFDFYVRTSAGNTTNTAWWLIGNSSNSTNVNNTRHVGFGYDTGISGTMKFYTFNGGAGGTGNRTTFDATGGGALLGPDKWMQLRMDINTSTQTFSLYTRDLGNSTWSQLTAGNGTITSFAFRYSGNFTALNHIWISDFADTASTAGSGSGSYTDNIVIIPEPSSFALLAICGLGLAYTIRRRKAKITP